MKVYIAKKNAGDQRHRMKFREAGKGVKEVEHVRLNITAETIRLDYAEIKRIAEDMADLAMIMQRRTQEQAAMMGLVYFQGIGKDCAMRLDTTGGGRK